MRIFIKNYLTFVLAIMLALPLISGCDYSDNSAQGAVALQSIAMDEGTDDLETATDIGPEFPVRMGNAENVCFTDTGRTFITGDNVAELTADGPVKLMPGNYGTFAGIAQAGPWLYVVCSVNRETIQPLDLEDLLSASDIIQKLSILTDSLMDKKILRADLRSGGPDQLVFTAVHQLTGMLIANGMAADSRGNLYIADETFLPLGKIVKVTVSEDPVPVTSQETWLSSADGIYSPNGMCIRDDVLYFTDFDIYASNTAQVKKVSIINGNPGTVELVYSRPGLFDDLDAVIYKGKPTVAVASFFGGNIHIIDEESGTVTKAGGGTLQCPSSVHFGRGGWVREDELIVTEVGMLYEPYSSYGNRVDILAVPE